MTRAQAIEAGGKYHSELHYGECKTVVGPRGGEKHKIEIWRVNGACKLWKTRPERFMLPIKWGFKGPYSYVTENNAALFHLADEWRPVRLVKALCSCHSLILSSCKS